MTLVSLGLLKESFDIAMVLKQQNMNILDVKYRIEHRKHILMCSCQDENVIWQS